MTLRHNNYNDNTNDIDKLVAAKKIDVGNMSSNPFGASFHEEHFVSIGYDGSFRDGSAEDFSVRGSALSREIAKENAINAEKVHGLDETKDEGLEGTVLGGICF